jgi:hypothetical protein
MYAYRNIDERSRNNCCGVNTINITHFSVCMCVCACVNARACGFPGAWACACVCVRVALLTQHATRMRHIVTSFLAPLAPSYFSTLSRKQMIFEKQNVTEHKVYLIFSTTIV